MVQGVWVLLLRTHSASHCAPYLNNELSHCSLAFSGLGSVVSFSTALPCSEARSAFPDCLSIPLAPCCLLLGAGCPCCSHFFQPLQSPRCCLHILLPTWFQLSPVPLSLTPSSCTPTLYQPFSPLSSPGTSGFSSNPFSTIKLKRAVFQTFLHAFQLLEAFNCCLFPFMIYCCS